VTAIWFQFEQAVAAFCAALAPDAVVTHNVMIPDVDTGSPRQRDVWIEARIGGFFPVKVLVSCKRYARKIDTQHLDAFIGELASSGAHKGVIYSLVGFTRPALEKAKKKGISCCILLADQPPPIPDVLVFDAYFLDERIRIEAQGTSGSIDWPGLLNAHGIFEMEEMPAYRALARTFAKALPDGHRVVLGQKLHERRVCLPITATDREGSVTLCVQGVWAIYRARTEAWLVNGSYSVTDEQFAGRFSTPTIDTWGVEPGPGWTPITDDEIVAGNTIAFVRVKSDVEPLLQRLAAGETPELKT
jgi:hypothetical protein